MRLSRSTLPALSLASTFFLYLAPAAALPTPDYTPADLHAPFKRLLSADICVSIDLTLQHKTYTCTNPSVAGAYAGDVGIPIADANTPVYHGPQSAGNAFGDPGDKVPTADGQVPPTLHQHPTPEGPYEPGQSPSNVEDGQPHVPGVNDTAPVNHHPVVATPARKRQNLPYTAAGPSGEAAVCKVTSTATITIQANVCICISAGVLTSDSIATITAAVNSSANAQAISTLTTPGPNGKADYANKAAIIAALEAEVVLQVGSQSTKCIFGPGAIPDSCGNCHFHCPPGQMKCNGGCIKKGAMCPSGGVTRKRDDMADIQCPVHKTACPVPSLSLSSSGSGFECIDVTSDLESCGGCAFPLSGKPKGQDCTALKNTLSVACKLGSCVIEACERGFELNTSSTACVAVSKSTKSHPDSRKPSLRDITKARQVKAAALRTRKL